MPIRRLAWVFAALGLLPIAGAPALAQDKTVTLKMSSWVPPAHPLNPSLVAWAADIEKESGGTIKATLFPSEQLGKAMDHFSAKTERDRQTLRFLFEGQRVLPDSTMESVSCLS